MATRQEMIAAIRSNLEAKPSREEMLAALRSDNQPKAQVQAQPEPQFSKTESALQGFGNAATLGYLPELQAAASKLVPDSHELLDMRLKNMGFTVEESPRPTTSTTDQMRERQQAVQKENPISYGAGSLGGAVASAPVYGGLLNAAKITAPVTGIGSGIYQGAKAGAVLGAAQNPNENPGQVGLNVGGRSWNAAKGGVIGGVAGAASGLLSRAANPEELQQSANSRAFKALDPKLRDIRLNKNRMDQIGQTALDEGIIGQGKKSYEEMADIAEQSLEKTGKKLDAMINEIDSLANAKSQQMMASDQGISIPGQAQTPRVGLKVKDMADAARSDMDVFSEVAGSGNPAKKYSAVIAEFEAKHPDIIGIKEANSLKIKYGQYLEKSNVWNKLKMGQSLSPEEQAQRAIYDKLKVGVEDAADAVAQEGSPELAQAYKALKSKYQDLKSITAIANKSAERQIANRNISLSDYQSGEIGAIMGSALGHDPLSAAGGALAAGAANKAGRLFGNQAIAGMENKAAQAIKAGGLVSKGLIKAGQAAAKTPAGLLVR